MFWECGMTQLDRALSEIQKRRSVRTPILGAVLDMSDEAVDALLADARGDGRLISCAVEVGGKKVMEYRCSTSGAGDLSHVPIFTKRHREPDPVRARMKEGFHQPAQASGGPDASRGDRPAAPAPVFKEKPVAKQTNQDKVVEFLKKHGQSTTEQIAKGIRTTNATLSTFMGTLCKTRGVRRVKRGVYEMAGGSRAGEQPTPPGRTADAARKDSQSAFAQTLADLRSRRGFLMAEISKLDAAIEAVEAIAA